METDNPHAPSTMAITGSSGFVGRGILAALGRSPDREPVGPFAATDIRLLQRRPGPTVPGATAIAGDVTDRSSLAGTLDGVETLVHLVGIIDESGGATFDRVVRQGTEHVLDEAVRAGVRHVIFMSALGAQDTPRFPYHQAKYRAEQAVKGSSLPYTIFRPSVIFAEGDGFISVLAGVVRSFPVVPVVGDGKARFQPVARADVADAFAWAVGHPDAAAGKTYELGGGAVYTYEEMIDVIAATLGKRKPKVHLPVPMMKAVVRASRPLPGALRPPVTLEQLNMLAIDNSTAASATSDLIGRPATRLEDGIEYIRRLR